MADFADEVPMRIHRGNSHLTYDGTPEITGEFVNWLSTTTKRRREYDSAMDSQLRVKRAMRILRGVAPREHDVMWRTLRGDSVQSTMEWLNERAERQGHPERYSLKDVVVLICSGTDKLAFWY